LYDLRVTFKEPNVGDDQYVEREIPWDVAAGDRVKRVGIQGDCRGSIEVEIIDRP
jgi:hypothetical protein